MYSYRMPIGDLSLTADGLVMHQGCPDAWNAAVTYIGTPTAAEPGKTGHPPALFHCFPLFPLRSIGAWRFLPVDRVE